ncbi:hypothetical protein [Xanthobacter versatilis]|uniref:hypothetical protein n=1 Tax=Xanthobacter autotrophicus (strain ATCC BAA-1158 / Py2) TaxID=78245 RepID=UPI0037281EC1
MDAIGFLVTLLVIGVPLAMFFALRRTKHPAPSERQAAPATPARRPPADFGMAREGHDAPAPAAEPSSGTPASGAAAAAAGGAFILAVEAARQHAGESGGESADAGHRTGHGGNGPDSGADSGSGGA